MENTQIQSLLEVKGQKLDELGRQFDQAIQKNVELAQLKKIFQEMKLVRDEMDALKDSLLIER